MGPASPRGGRQGADHWTPGELRLLPRQALDWLVELYQDAEAGEGFPPEIFLNLVTLIPRGKGPEAVDQRPIAVLPRAYRLWARMRTARVREWRAQQPALGHDYGWGGAAARTALHAVWASEADSELAVARGDARVEVLFDCTKCYELIQFQDLAGKVLDAGFPPAIAKLAINQYMHGRWSSWAGSRPAPLAH